MAEIILKNEDCVTVMAGMPPDSVDLILTDPPYNIADFMRARNEGIRGIRPNFFAAAGWDDADATAWEKSMDDFLGAAARVIKGGGSMVVFMAIINVHKIIKLAERHGFYYKTTGIWHKTNPMPRNMKIQFVNSTETWIYFTYKKKTGVFNGGGTVHHDYIETPVISKKERKHGAHPTQKPERLMGYFINLLAPTGGLVMDPFMGSGTAGVAAVKHGMDFVGCEINPLYYQIAQKQIEGAGGTIDTVAR